MRYYESLYIVNPNYEQDRLDEVIKTVAEKIDEYGFSIINHRLWGKKRLAYPIEKHKYGSYVLIHFETDSLDKLSNFERFMELQKPVLRNQTVRLDIRPEIITEEESVEELTENSQSAIKETVTPAVEEPTLEESEKLEETPDSEKEETAPEESTEEIEVIEETQEENQE